LECVLRKLDQDVAVIHAGTASEAIADVCHISCGLTNN
jgi:hypothetical protein